MTDATSKPSGPDPSPDIYSLLTRRSRPSAETQPPIAITGRKLIGREPRDAPTTVRNLDDQEVSLDVGPYILRDTYPIPTEADREWYSTGDDAGYWVSGLRDYLKVREAFARHVQGDVQSPSLLDFGCASGRFLRHVRCHQPGTELWGCDIDRKNVDWVLTHLPAGIRAFQNSVYPSLPIPDASFNVVTAFSVFTHIDTFEDTWLLELRRVLRPGGIAFVTFHSERTWLRIKDLSFVLKAMLECRHENGDAVVAEDFARPMPAERLVLTWRTDSAYRCNVFHSIAYVLSRWGRFFEPCAVYDGGIAGFQDIVVLRRT